MDLSQEMHPAAWLVFGMAWSGSDDDVMAEAAYAVAPGNIPPKILSTGWCRDVVDLSVAIAAQSGHRTVFLTDVTAFLEERGQPWQSIKVDWEAALDELQNAPILGLYLTLSQRAHAILCWTGRGRLVLYSAVNPAGEEIHTSERETVRGVVTEFLDRDWPAYAQQVLSRHDAAGTLRRM